MVEGSGIYLVQYEAISNTEHLNIDRGTQINFFFNLILSVGTLKSEAFVFTFLVTHILRIPSGYVLIHC